MCRSLVQCAFVWFYGPLSHSMFLRSILWTVISFNVPLFRSMDRYLAMCLHLVLWTVLSFNVPSFFSMSRSLVQCAFVSFFVLFFRSMFLRLFLSAFLSFNFPW